MTTQTTLEERVERIEKHLSKKSWLDEDSGYTMSNEFPLSAKIFAWFLVALALLFFVSCVAVGVK